MDHVVINSTKAHYNQGGIKFLTLLYPKRADQLFCPE